MGHPNTKGGGQIIPSKLFLSEERDTCHMLANSQVCRRVVNSVFEQNNPGCKKMGYQQIRNVSNMMKDMRSEKLIGYNMSSSDKMIIELDENQYPYMVLKNKVHPVSLMSSLHSEASTHDHDNTVNSLLPLS